MEVREVTFGAFLHRYTFSSFILLHLEVPASILEGEVEGCTPTERQVEPESLITLYVTIPDLEFLHLDFLHGQQVNFF